MILIRLLRALAQWAFGWMYAQPVDLCSGVGCPTIYRPGHPVGWCSQCQRIVSVNPSTGTANGHPKVSVS